MEEKLYLYVKWTQQELNQIPHAHHQIYLPTLVYCSLLNVIEKNYI